MAGFRNNNDDVSVRGQRRIATRTSGVELAFGKHSLLLYRLFFTLLMVFVGVASSYATTDKMPAPLMSACEIEYPPFSIVDGAGRADGFSVELMRAALAAMNREVIFRTGPWAEVRGWLENGEVEALPLVGRTPEREALFDFTIPYMTLHGAIVVRKGVTDIHNLEDLKGLQVAVMKGDNAEEFLRREDRGITIRTTPTFEDALRELSEGKYAAVVMQRLVAVRLIQEGSLENLRVTDEPIEGFSQEFCFAVKEGNRDTLALLNEGLALVMADGTHRQLHSKWFAALELPENKPIIVGGDHNYPPFEYLDEQGNPAGYNVELTRALAKATDLDIEIRLGPWDNIIKDLKRGAVDIMQGMFYLPERDQKFDFTQPHDRNHYVVAGRKGKGKLPETIEALSGKRIIVQSGDAAHDYLVSQGLEKNLFFANSQEEVLQELTEGRYDCAVVARISALHLIKERGWNKLVLGQHPLVSLEYCYAVPEENKALLALFSEGLKMLEASGEYRHIHDKWLGIYQEKSISTLTALRYSAFVIIPLLLLLALGFVWSWSLRRQVAEKTRELRHSLERFREVFEAANVGKSITRPTGEINVNQAFADYLGYTPEELKGKRWQDITPPDFVPEVEKKLNTLFQGLNSATRFEKPYLHKNGDIVWADISVALRRDQNGDPLYFITTVVDITARRQAEERLQHLTEVLRAIRNVNQLITHEKDTETLLCQACEILTETRGYQSVWIGMRNADGGLGLAASSGIGEDFRPLLAQLDHNAVPECCRLAKDQGDIVVMHNPRENCVPCPLAQSYRGTAALAGLLQHNDREYGAIVVSLPVGMADDPEEISLFKELAGDVSYALYGIEIEKEQHLAADALRASETNYRLLADNTVDCIWRLNLDVVFEYINPASMVLLGYSPEEMIGSPLSKYCDEENYAIMASEIAAALAAPANFIRTIFQAEMIRRDGSLINVEITGKILRLDDGTAIGLQGVTRDITERVAAQQALRESEAQFRSYVEEAPFGIFLTDRTGRYLSVNPAAARITGYSEEELCAMSVSDLFGADSLELGMAHFQKLLVEGESYGELTCLHKSGEPRQWYVSAVKLSEERFLGFAEDITERKRAEREHESLQAQLVQSQKMESVGRLAGGVAHDFNNMLGVILGFTEMAMDKVEETHPVYDDLQEVMEAGKRSAEITRQLLAFARKQTIMPKVLNLNETVETMLSMLRRLIGENIDLSWISEDGLWPVKMDPSQLDQILANLCVNAKDAIKGVGKLTIETGKATFDEEYCASHLEFVPGDYVMLAVSDDGCGMDTETKGHLFEPFFTTKKIGEGTGLGLATVYGIVRQNNGFINVYSEPGQGTTFRIYLPRHIGETEVKEQIAEQAPLPSGKGKTVLIVEDEVALLKMGQNMLESLEYNVLAAANPKEALQLAKEYEGKIDLLVTDVIMPGMNGRDLAQQIQQQYPGIRILFMSGYTANVIAHHGVLDDNIFFIQKPFSIQELAAKANAALMTE